MSHKKKPFDTLKKGQFNPEDMRNAVRDVLNGILTIDEAVDKYKVKKRTLQNHCKYVLEGLRLQRGPGYKELVSLAAKSLTTMLKILVTTSTHL